MVCVNLFVSFLDFSNLSGYAKCLAPVQDLMLDPNLLIVFPLPVQCPSLLSVHIKFNRLVYQAGRCGKIDP